MRSEITSSNLTWRSTRGPPPRGHRRRHPRSRPPRPGGGPRTASRATPTSCSASRSSCTAWPSPGAPATRAGSATRPSAPPPWITHGLMVAHIGLFDSHPATRRSSCSPQASWPLMWRRSRPRSTADRREPGADCLTRSLGGPPAGPGVPIHGSRWSSELVEVPDAMVQPGGLLIPEPGCVHDACRDANSSHFVPHAANDGNSAQKSLVAALIDEVVGTRNA